jgi:hypothetical protein
MSEELKDTFLGASRLQPSATAPEESVGRALAAEVGETVVVISFEASAYPLENHCRFALHSSDESPYTFPNFRFNPRPPGLRVGPWPGWRGIPEMPDATLVAGKTETRLKFEFWGDEFETRRLRAVARIGSLQSDTIVVRTGDSRLIPSEAQFYRSKPLRPTRVDFTIPKETLRSHPRLLVNLKTVDELRQDKSAARLASLKRLHDLLPQWDRTFVITAESKLPSGPELLSPEDRLLIGALLALIEPSEEDIRRGVRSLLDYTDQTTRPDFSPLTIDTQAGESLFLLCVGYDWLLEHLSPEEEAIVRKRIWEIADVCWNHLGYERNDYAQAHYLGCGLGLLAFSLLFWDTHQRAREWASHLAGVLALVLTLLPPDGFFAHGMNLWIYEFSFLLRWMELFRSAGGWDPWTDSDVMRNSSAFRAAAVSPDGLYGITFGDPQYRVGGDSWCHYLIALRTGSKEAHSLGDHLLDLPVEGVDYRNAPARRRVYEYLWRSSAQSSEPAPSGLYLANDGGQVFVRTGKSLFTFRSGPPLGKHRLEMGLTGGYGHSDPCNGSFLLYQGVSLLVSGPGPVYRRDTALHNVVTINGQGQIGDTAVWMPDFLPPSTLSPTPDLRRIGDGLSLSVDLARSYLPHLAVKSLRRALLVLPDEYILGADVVTVANRSSIEWNIHSWHEFTREKRGETLKFNIGVGTGCSLTILSLPTQDVEIRTGKTDFAPAYPNDGVRDNFLQLVDAVDRISFFWCLGLNGNAPSIAAGPEGQAVWELRGGERATFDGTWISLKETP